MSAPQVVALALPLLLAVAVAVIAVVARTQGGDAPVPPDTRPLAVAPIDSPDAAGPDCTALVGALPAELATSDGPLVTRPIDQPDTAPGVRAWAAAPRPVVLRCGLTRPAELAPDSALLEVNGVRWLQLDDGLPEPVQVSYIAVDRPVYVALSTPVDVGTGPLQQVADVVRATLPVTPVRTG
ncbi:hypothetical protein BJF78_20380 [Pseudonocardia sp. CNS-139]|nr:hypothetical protein BJF78_20380 [Pseudonocardia sp. CNS-139]